jgi:hypothetical protein
MAATYVTEAQLRSALGIGSLYDDATLESVCQAAEDLISKMLWFNKYPIVGASIYDHHGFVVVSANPSFVTGQTVTISKTGAHYNGNHTITGTWPWTTGSATFPWYSWWPYNRATWPYGYSMLQFDVAQNIDNENYHLIVPYGEVAISAGSPDYAAEPLVNQAALMLAIDIWQARQQSNAGGVSPDFSPSPYRMGSSLLARIRGLIAPFLSPGSMVG